MDKPAVSVSHVKTMTAPNFTYFLHNSLTFSQTRVFSPSATHLFLLAGTNDVSHWLAAAAYVPPPSCQTNISLFKVQSDKTPRLSKRPVTLSLSAACLSITRVPTPANSLEPDSLFSRRRLSNASVALTSSPLVFVDGAEVSFYCARRTEARL